MSREFIAQIVGCVGIVVFLACYHTKDMRSARKVKLATDIIWATHFFMLGAYAGGCTNTISIGRELVFLNQDKKLFKSRLWMYFFIALNYVCAIITWKGIFNIFPAMAATLGTISFWQKDIRVARWMGLVVGILMFVYDTWSGSYMGMVAETLSTCSIIIAIYRNRKSKFAA